MYCSMHDVANSTHDAAYILRLGVEAMADALCISTGRLQPGERSEIDQLLEYLNGRIRRFDDIASEGNIRF